MLKLKGISIQFGSYQALQNIDMEIRPGELVVLLGANGSGKSTLFRTISGLLRPASGTIEFNNQRIDGIPSHKVVRLGISQCPEGRQLFAQLSVQKNLLLGSFSRRRDKNGVQESLSTVYELFPALKDKRNAPAGSLSGGQQQMLAIGRALMSSPQLLMLDEPSIGLAPLVVNQMFEIIKKVNEKGTMILLAEQNANMALKISRRGYVLENGRIVMHDHSEALAGNEEVRKAYIGA
ncbi:ABC transporter ATP-binding protein [Paradesulfitobacterium aromaticivorans]